MTESGISRSVGPGERGRGVSPRRSGLPYGRDCVDSVTLGGVKAPNAPENFRAMVAFGYFGLRAAFS